MVNRLFVILTFMMLSFSGLAQFEFSAAIQAPKEVSTDDRITLRFTYNKDGEFEPPAFKDFHAQFLGQSSSGMYMNINGKVRDNRTFYLTYSLTPKKPGKLVIEAASLQVGDKKKYTAPITIEVVKGKKPQYANGAIDPNAEVVAKMIPSKRQLYKGESFTVTYKIYTPFIFRQLAGFDIETYNGFNKHALITVPGKNTNYSVDLETINGRRYQTITLERELLVSNKPGKYTLDPYSVKVVISDRRGFTDVKEVRSNPLTINVKDLPSAGKPEDFTGAVGQYKITAEASNQELTEGDDGFDLTINVSGKGNTDFDDPKIELINEFDAYPPETNEDKKIRSSGISINKSYNYFTVPQQNGEFELGPFTFSYFDPEKEKYVTAATEPITIKVDNPNIKAERIAGNKKMDIESETKELRFIKTETDLESQDDFLAGSVKYWIALGSPALLFFLLIFVTQRKQEEDPEAIQSKKASRAGKLAKQRLNKAAGFIASNDQNAFYSENLRAMYAYLSEKIQMQAHDMSKQNIREKLENMSVSARTSEEFIRVLEACEMARYAAFSQDANDIYKKSLNVIVHVENEIKTS